MNFGRRTARQACLGLLQACGLGAQRRVPDGQHVTHRPRRWLQAAACAAALLAACGGGTSQFESFEPDQYVAFGDESSVIRADGRRFTVNPLNAFGALECNAEPIWVQAVATQFQFVFQQCNPDNATEFKALMRAQSGARTADLATQIDNQIAAGGFANKSLATVLIGANDVLEMYATYPQQTEEQITAELRDRGVRLAAQVNRLVDLGVRVIVSTVPDLGLSPFALQQKAAFTDTDRAELLTRLVAAYNGRLRVNILNDGRFVGLVLGDEAVQAIVKFPDSFSVTSATSAVCTVAVPDCTSLTVVDTGTSAKWLWADDTHLAYAGQARLGTLAVARAIGNPF
jgi:outer membrane lipase/esterase